MSIIVQGKGKFNCRFPESKRAAAQGGSPKAIFDVLYTVGIWNIWVSMPWVETVSSSWPGASPARSTSMAWPCQVKRRPVP